MTRSEPKRHRPGLTEKQQTQLARFEKRKRISEYERGQLVAFRLFGSEEEARQATRILKQAKETTQ